MQNINVDWNRYAEQYDAICTSGSNPAYMQLLDKVVRYFKELPIKKRSLVADLGGGTGNFTLALAQHYPDSTFVIVDSSETMLEKAKGKAHIAGLENIDVVLGDVENIAQLTTKYSRPFTHVIMIHCLYATRSKEDSAKPHRILKNICEGMEDSSSRCFVSDINRQLNTSNWIPYCLWNAYRNLRSMKKTIQYFKENDQAKLANRYIDLQQKSGNYLVCELDEFVNMIRAAGFAKIHEKSDRYYRGRDNLVIAGK